LGQKVAHMEMGKVVPQLVRTFDFELDDSLKSEEGWKTFNHWLVEPHGLKCKIEVHKPGALVEKA